MPPISSKSSDKSYIKHQSTEKSVLIFLSSAHNKLMKYQKKIMILYFARLLLVIFVTVPLLSLFSKSINSIALYGLSFLSYLVSGLCLFLRAKSFELVFTEDEMFFSKGVIVKSTVCVRFKNIRAIGRYYSPLERLLGLVSISLYTEGKSFLLFPAEAEALRKIAEKGGLSL